MKLSKTILPLLLSSALWIPMAYAADNPNDTNTVQQPAANQPANGQQPATPSSEAQQPANQQPANASTNANASTATTASMDTSSWSGKTVKGSDGKKIGTVNAAAGDKVTVGTKYGDIELAANLVADDGTGNLTASTTSTKDVQAMAKSQKGDMKGAQAASKRHFAKKEPKAKVQPASMKSGEETAPTTEQAPAGQAPATTEQAPPANTPPASTQQPTTPQSPQH